MEYTQEYLEMMDRETPHLMGHLRYMEVLSKESDRGAVLVTVSMLEDALTELLRARLVQGKSTDKLLDGFNAPLGTFSAKIAAAHAIGVIPEEWRRELELLRNIRNKFAHNVTVTLGDKQIMDRCNELSLCLPEKAKDAAGARRRYWMSATAILVNSLNALHEGKVLRIDYS